MTHGESQGNAPSTGQAARSALVFSLASVLFFCSGGTGLAYQVAWSKRFSHVWGSSTLAMAAVVASFLFGLGLGAHLLGKFADRTRSGLFWYGAAEVAIGLLALIIPFEIQGLRAVSSFLYPFLGGIPALHTLARFLFTFLVIGPACILMGGTLPLLIRHFTTTAGGPRASAGWLYAINTLGAATGAYVAGFHLLPGWGLFRTNLAVAVLNLLIGGLALVAGRISTSADFAASPRPERRGPTPLPLESNVAQRALLNATVALTGAASLILEMVWTRQLAVLLGGTTYAFSSMLFLLLVGIGLGSLIYHVSFRRTGAPPLAAAFTIAGIAVATWAGKTLIPELSILVGAVKDLRAQQGWNAVIAAGSSAVLELIPALGMGLLFPIFIERTRRSARDTGKAIGAIYAWNTVGSIAGATATFLVLVPRLGLANTAGVALILYGIALLLSFPGSPDGSPRRVPALVACCVAVSLSWYGTQRELDPFDTDMGLYMYGSIPGARERFVVRYFAEGQSSNVMVTETIPAPGLPSNFSLHVNGKVDASSVHDMNMQLGLAYLPLLLRPESKAICVIGFGSGTTSGAALLFPQTQVTCCEIEPAVVHASKYFSHVNHSPELSDRFHLVLDDGRSHLQGVRATYDIILSEPSNPWIAGVSNLFTREFYVEALSKLSPGGILAQWLQVYNFSPEDYAMIARTVLEVFPECALIRISSGDTILLASSARVTGTAESCDRAQALVNGIEPARRDLLNYFHTTDVRTLLLAHLFLDTRGVRKLIAASAEAHINTDLNLKLEFDAPLRLFGGDTVSASTMARILASVDLEGFKSRTEGWRCGKDQAAVFRDIAKLFDAEARKDLVEGLAELRRNLDPEKIELVVDRLATTAPPEEIKLLEQVDKVLEVSPVEANRLGVLLFKGAKFEQAVQVFRRILGRHPQSCSTLNNLAVTYDAWGKPAEAEEAFRSSLAIDPVHKETNKSFETFQRKRKVQEEALKKQGPGTPEAGGLEGTPNEDTLEPPGN